MKAEAILHRAVVAQYEARKLPGTMCWHPMQNPRSAVHGANLIRLGFRAGVSDLNFLRKGTFLAMELKAPGKKPTEHQQEFLAAVRACKFPAVVCDNIDDATAVLKQHGFIR